VANHGWVEDSAALRDYADSRLRVEYLRLTVPRPALLLAAVLSDENVPFKVYAYLVHLIINRKVKG
jgi:hypothetical protein